MKIRSFLISITIFASLPTAALSQDNVLTLEIIGKGEIKIESNETSCLETCQQPIANNSVVSLSFEETSGYKFSKWGQDSCDSGEGVLLNSDKQALITQEFRPKEVAFADFNSDGLQDMATISLFSSQLTVNISQGDGQYQQSQTFSDSDYSSSMAIVDWEGDNDIDIFVVDYHSNVIFPYMNDGNGTFTLADVIEIGNERPYSLAIADINQDGLNDLLLGSFNANILSDSLRGIVRSITKPTLKWYVNQGNNQFSLYQDIPTEGAFFKLAVGKISGSSQLDIVGTAINLNTVLSYSLTTGGYTESSLFVDNYVYGLALGDIDQNGKTDILVTSYYGQAVSLLTQNNDGGFASSTVYQSDDGLTSVALTDIDSNGIDDVVWGEFDNRVINWLSADSLTKCMINMNSDRTVQAEFIETASDNTDNSNSAPQLESSKDNSSSGGSFGLLGFFALAIYSFRKSQN